jgi:hypothetical protein
MDVDGVDVEAEACLFEESAGADDLVEYLVAVGEDLAGGGGGDEEGPGVLGVEEAPGGVEQKGVVAAVVGGLVLERFDLVG